MVKSTRVDGLVLLNVRRHAPYCGVVSDSESLPRSDHSTAAPHATAISSTLDRAIAARLKRDANGLIVAVAQQHDTGEVLMVAWMNDEALHRTLATGLATYFSRSRGRLWVKGETSGHIQRVHTVKLDCDGDTVLLGVDQEAAACHSGDRTCFDDRLLLTAPGARRTQ